jgi:esterase/lipase superfamily enzyme
MNKEHQKWWSSSLNQDMELNIYGHAGKPIIVFPAQGGRFWDFESFGMISTVEWFVDNGIIQLITVDSIDNQSWANESIHPSRRADRHEDYDRYIMNEVVPMIKSRVNRERYIMTTGVSMGGYHSGNFFFRHPDVFDSVISLSGLFSLKLFVGDYVDENVFYNSPLLFLPGLSDQYWIDNLRKSNIIVCCGQGAWEDNMMGDIKPLKKILQHKGIPAWIDLWGFDVNHDWPWWLKQFPFFINELYKQGKLQ